MSAFSTALSGLSSNSAALEVVGNNLANLNTQGFKGDEVLFKDILGQTAGSAQIGGGVTTPYTAKQFSQGSLQATNGAFDVAIQGNGLFMVQNSSGKTMYTRDGSFKIDGKGQLVTATGEAVQGWSAVNGVLTPSGPVSNLSVTGLGAQTPSATTAMTLNANLSAAAAVNDKFSTPIQVVDSLGVAHILTATFTKTGANAWTYDVGIPGQDLTGGTAGTQTSLVNGTLTFDSSGVLTDPAAGTPVNVATTTGLSSGAADLNINWSLYDANGSPLLTQFAQASDASATSQDGIQPSSATVLRIADGGILMATTSTGKQIALGQIAVATVGNPDSLSSVGNNFYELSADTSDPTVGIAGTGSRGQIRSGSLEASNVDLAREFTNLIIYQRGYQANSKAITTQDQITQVLMNMK